ncbi:PemK-like, MazF-like toxin of type II toxin-antitoxin system [Streptomyces sp. Amel2xB2]|uniref:type II toxin-antitoxin system PemK/MazF family toxin n=1 Tax=Streptomyces sp. Amel2xB2 TaxID=1305829 RepID=UPI000DBAC6AE|nr:type II toxin-antitoxin system PemK/MazF family toxin [Streptomyces sp. Amel2xB2]RAJ65598.1 PemK-like, MazF-like toxin of type II toxin-antitoxin system [Streptomyces sp. Amel2xB2]
MSHSSNDSAGGASGIRDGSGGPGSSGPTATCEVEPDAVGTVRTSYAPDPDGDPDPGEIIWTWVPYEEDDGRGKDRPVLIVAREGHGTVLGVQLSSQERAARHGWLPLGSGPWDASGRDSWVSTERVLRVHPEGMRREACALDRARFQRVVHRLQQLYGWR